MSNMVYCRKCGKQIYESDSFCPHCGAPQKVDSPDVNTSITQQQTASTNANSNVNTNPQVGGMSQKRLAAALFAFFLGGFGIHKFYLGQVGMGILYLLFCWTCIPIIVGFIEGIIYISMSDADFEAKYGK